jgi:2-methylcitrate dehydratase PrpD
MSSIKILEPLARWGAQAGRDWNSVARERAHAALCDMLVCTAAGAREGAGLRVSALAGDGDCVVVGHAKRASPQTAALINGTAAHALDFDDNFSPARVHASAVLFPALLALGEAREAAMEDILDSFICGLEIVGRIGQLMNPRHRNRGWHATATLGAIGAAAASARLLRLDADKFRHALSLASSRAGGSMIQFGVDAKPIHAGFAADAGVVAARLAYAGATGARETIAGPKGLADLMHAGDVGGIDESSIGGPLLIETAGLKAKRFPNCASAHRAMDALLMLIGRHGFTARDVNEIVVEMPAPQLANLMFSKPSVSAEARFSLNYALAVVLARGAPTLEDFSDEAVRRPELQELLPLVRPTPVDTTEIDYPQKITVILKDGRKVSETVSIPRGAAKNPFNHDEFLAKARSCLEASALAERADVLIAAFDFSADTPVQDLMSQYSTR